MTKKRVYLDTNIIVKRILKDDTSRDFDQEWYNLIKHYDIIIPQMIVGETLTIILARSKDKNTDVKAFTDLLQNEIKMDTNLPSLNGNILNTALSIKRKEDYIDYCDAVLVAHAMNDGNNCWVYTNDTNVQHSEHVFNMCRELKKDKGIQVNIIQGIP